MSGPQAAAVPEPFEVVSQGRTVPGVLWRPPPTTPRPLVLLGHGGGGDKMAVEYLALRLVEDFGFAAAAIDGPVHGARRSDHAGREQVLEDFRALWRKGQPAIDEMVADWTAALEHLAASGAIDAASIGWAGVSMGTAYGLPFVAAEPRIKAAAFGMWGLSYPSTERLARDAPRVVCPVLFQRKADDELFSVEGQEELFDLIGSSDKRLAVYPGGHVTPAGDQLDDIVGFLGDHLGDVDPS